MKKSGERERPHLKREILLLRNGQHEDTDVSSYQKPLTKLGKVQATVTGNFFKNFNVELNGIYFSPYQRTTATAEEIFISASLLSSQLRFEESVLLESNNPVPLDPTETQTLSDKYFFVKEPIAEAAFRKFFHRPAETDQRNSRILLITHVNMIGYLLMRALQFPRNYYSRVLTSHCSLTVVSINADGVVSLNSMGDVGHLPPELISE